MTRWSVYISVEWKDGRACRSGVMEIQVVTKIEGEAATRAMGWVAALVAHTDAEYWVDRVVRTFQKGDNP